MLIVTIENISGRSYTPISVVKGAIVLSKHVGEDILVGMKNIMGGELTGYTDMMNEAREEATTRMVAEALSLGADAIVGVRVTLLRRLPREQRKSSHMVRQFN